MTSLRAYAKHRGVTLNAVRTAIEADRLVKSVSRDARGQPKISDIALADREWAANTLPRLGQPDTRPPRPAPSDAAAWPDWAPLAWRELDHTWLELLAGDFRGDRLMAALVALHREEPEPRTALDAFLERLERHLPPHDLPNLPIGDCLRMELAEALDPDED